MLMENQLIWTLGLRSSVHHRLTNPPQECNRVDKTYFCEVPENIEGQFTFCDQYCSYSDFTSELTDPLMKDGFK